MLDTVVRILINAVALVVAAKIVPDIHLTIGKAGPEWVKIAIIAIVFGLVNAYIKPIVKVLSFPIGWSMNVWPAPGTTSVTTWGEERKEAASADR